LHIISACHNSAHVGNKRDLEQERELESDFDKSVFSDSEITLDKENVEAAGIRNMR
jgi:hypothetical protein